VGTTKASAPQREVFCGVFCATHVPYDPDEVRWPDLDDDQYRILSTLPIWSESVNAEHETAVIVSAMAAVEDDPVVAEAIRMQAYEEERHARLVTSLTEHYGFAVTRIEPVVPQRPEQSFLRSGWGECLDSFVAFGVYGLARDSGLVHGRLLDIFDLVLTEEARHIVFFENWRRWRASGTDTAGRAAFEVSSSAAIAAVLWARAVFALSAVRAQDGSGETFLWRGSKAWDPPTPRRFLERCVTEHAGRMATMDPRLNVPRMVPSVARAIALIGRGTLQPPVPSATVS
jgi:hypothetical protein